jgi:arylsulfatase A-like enzyme
MDKLVLLITVDSLRADRVDSAESDDTDPTGLTPRIDELAAGGVSCTDAFATGPGTRQSFPGILSSTPPLAHGGYNQFGPDRPAVAERFRSAGFTTGAVHSNAQLATEFGYDRGFDEFRDLYSGGGSTADTGGSLSDDLRDRVGAVLSDYPQLYRGVKRIELRLQGINRPYATATHTRERANDWLSDQSGQVFLWVHFMDVHVPYYPPRQFRNEVGCGDVSDTDMGDLWLKLNANPEEITNEELATIEQLYDATVRYVDTEIGHLLEFARRETDGEVVVAFTSDHGDEFRDHGGLTHSPQLYQELVKVPLVFDLPDTSGELITSPVSLMDTAPTLLDVVNGDDEAMWGTPVTDSERDRTVFSEVAHPPDGPNDRLAAETRVTACRTADWTVIQDNARDRIEAYDRTADPTEQTPLSEFPTELSDRINTFRRRVDETSPELLEREMSDSVESRLEDLGYVQE